MLDQNFFSPVREPLTTAQSVFIFLPRNPNLDKTASALALFLSLKKSGKQVMVACPTEMTVEFADLFGVDKIHRKPQGQNLIVSFDYLEDSIEKVSYHIEENKFNLVIQPKKGLPPLATDSVKYRYSGGEADLTFLVGVNHLNDLGELKNSLVKEKAVNLNTRPGGQLAKINLIELAPSYAEIMAHLLSLLGLPVDEDIATNLLRGIEKATQRFSSPKTGPATLEAAAYCLRAGAKRVVASRRPRRKVSAKPLIGEISKAGKPAGPTKPTKDSKPAADWLEPKIYKGNTRI